MNRPKRFHLLKTASCFNQLVVNDKQSERDLVIKEALEDADSTDDDSVCLKNRIDLSLVRTKRLCAVNSYVNEKVLILQRVMYG